MSGGAEDRLNGLPGPLPPGEQIVWQGAPDFRRLLESAFHARLLGAYFALLALGGLMSGSVTGALVTVGAGLLCLGVVALLARAAARTSVYTLTDRRIVLRIGMALPMSFNLPLKQIEAADLRRLGGGCGDISLRLKGRGRVAYAMLWPHARPWRLRHPEPMLRAIPEAELVARELARCCAALVEIDQTQSGPVTAPVRSEPGGRPARRPSQPQPVGATA